MSHRRQPSEGLNIGDEFPTTYSTFAVNADSRSHDTSRSTTTSQSKRSSTHLKRRTSPPFDSLKQEGASLNTYSNTSPVHASSSPKITFEATSKSPLSTRKSWETTVKGFYKRWTFVVFFLAFSALVVCGTLLPVSRGKAPLNINRKSATAIKRDSILHRHVRAVRDTAASPQPEHQAVSNRFSRWAQTILGSEGVETPQTIQPIPVTAGLGDLEILPDEKDMIMAADPDPDIVMMAEKAMAERRAAKWAARWAKNKKRRTDDNGEDSNEEDLLDKGAHEHPSRVARRKKLTATQKVDDEARKKMMEKKKQAKNGVFERIARVFNAAAPSSPSVNAEPTQGENWKTKGAESKHILDTWGASHPELLDMDGGYAGF